MPTDDLQPIGEALAPISLPRGVLWTQCQVCEREWALPPYMRICPECQQDRTRQAILEWRKERRGALLAQYGIPTRLRKAADGEIQWPSDPRRPEFDLRQWTGQPWSLTIQGHPGSGKGRLAVEIAYRWACADVDLRGALWIRGSILAMMGVRGDNILGHVRACQLLIVDDFGPGLYSPVAWSIFGEVLAYRYDREAATILTTSLGQTRIEEEHSATANRLLAGVVCRLPGGKRRA